MDTWLRAPTEPEQTAVKEFSFVSVLLSENLHWNAEGTNTASVETLLWLNLSIFVEVWLQTVLEVDEEWWNSDDSSNQDTKECHTFSAQSETIDTDEDDRERLEPDVQETVDQGDVQVEQEYHWLGEVKSEWSDKRHHYDVLSCHRLGHQLWFGLDVWVACQLPDAPCTAHKEVVRAGLRKEEEQEHQAES